jgi:hypothetical protein
MNLRTSPDYDARICRSCRALTQAAGGPSTRPNSWRACCDSSTPPADGCDEPCLLHEQPGVLLPLQLRSATGTLTFVSTVTVFGTPHDITLQELAIESFFAADEFTAAELARLVTQPARN